MLFFLLAGATVLTGCDGNKPRDSVVGPESATAEPAPTLSKRAVDEALQQMAVANVTVTRDGMSAEGLEVAFSRSISGRKTEYLWRGTTNADGQVTVEIVSALPVAGLYLAKVTDPASGETIGKWGSIPINSGKVILTLPVGQRADTNSLGYPRPGMLVRIPGEFIFTEGPTADLEGNLYFSDVMTSQIYKLDTEGELTIFLENTQRTNGLMFDATGNRLIGAQAGTRQIIAVGISNLEIEVLADSSSGTLFGSPNDLALDRHGGIYFTSSRTGRRGGGQFPGGGSGGGDLPSGPSVDPGGQLPGGGRQPPPGGAGGGLPSQIQDPASLQTPGIASSIPGSQPKASVWASDSVYRRHIALSKSTEGAST